MRRAEVLVVAAVTTALTGLLLAGHGPWAGRVLVGLSDDHGLNTGDLPVIALYLCGLGACWRLWRGAEPPR